MQRQEGGEFGGSGFVHLMMWAATGPDRGKTAWGWGGQRPHTFQFSWSLIWLMMYCFLCKHISEECLQWSLILHKHLCGGTRIEGTLERCTVFSCRPCLRTWFSPALPFRPFPQRTGTTVEGGRVEEEVEGGIEGGLSHFKLRAIHLLFAFPSVLLFHFSPLLMFCRHLEIEDGWCMGKCGIEKRWHVCSATANKKTWTMFFLACVFQWQIWHSLTFIRSVEYS